MKNVTNGKEPRNRSSSPSGSGSGNNLNKEIIVISTPSNFLHFMHFDKKGNNWVQDSKGKTSVSELAPFDKSSIPNTDTKQKIILTKNNIGSPTNFEHTVHFGLGDRSVDAVRNDMVSSSSVNNSEEEGYYSAAWDDPEQKLAKLNQEATKVSSNIDLTERNILFQGKIYATIHIDSKISDDVKDIKFSVDQNFRLLVTNNLGEKYANFALMYNKSNTQGENENILLVSHRFNFKIGDREFSLLRKAPKRFLLEEKSSQDLNDTSSATLSSKQNKLLGLPPTRQEQVPTKKAIPPLPPGAQLRTTSPPPTNTASLSKDPSERSVADKRTLFTDLPIMGGRRP